MQRVALPPLNLFPARPRDTLLELERITNLYGAGMQQKLEREVKMLQIELQQIKKTNILPCEIPNIQFLAHENAMLHCDVALAAQALQAQIGQCDKMVSCLARVSRQDYQDMQDICTIAKEIISKVKMINAQLDTANCDNRFIKQTLIKQDKKRENMHNFCIYNAHHDSYSQYSLVIAEI